MFRIAVIPGDGIGPEVVGSAIEVLNALEENFGLRFETERFDIGSERYLKNGTLVTEEEFLSLEAYDTILFGAIGDPRVQPGVLEKGVLLAMRARFDQYINLRPCRSWHPFVPLKGDADFDIHFIRENTEDFYMGAGGRLSPDARKATLSVERRLYRADIDVTMTTGSDDEFAFEMGLLSRKGVERFADYVFRFAAARGEDRITLVDKANVCSSIYGFQRELFQAKAEEHGMGLDFMFVDAMAMALVRNPWDYHTVAVPNLFGDILTDLGAQVSGGLGLAASGNINPEGVSMFEPVHGSAPDIAGKGIANPFAAILATAMMLEQLGRSDLSETVTLGVRRSMDDGITTGDMGGSANTATVTKAVIDRMLDR